jgi:hypothetical protein
MSFRKGLRPARRIVWVNFLDSLEVYFGLKPSQNQESRDEPTLFGIAVAVAGAEGFS